MILYFKINIFVSIICPINTELSAVNLVGQLLSLYCILLQEIRELTPNKCSFCLVLTKRQEKAEGILKKKNLNKKAHKEWLIFGLCYTAVKKKHTDLDFSHFHISFMQKGQRTWLQVYKPINYNREASPNCLWMFSGDLFVFRIYIFQAT